MGGIQSRTKKAKKAPPAAISQVDRAVLDLKNARDRLNKYQRKLEQDVQRLVERARAAKYQGQPKVALQLLKLKTIKTREVENVEHQLLTVMQLVQTIDSKQNEAQVLDAMKVGKDALAKMHQETSVEDVLNLMDSIEEQHQVEQEISDILQGVPELSVADEEAVEAELEALMKMGENGEATPALPEVPTSKPLPVAPTTKLPDKATAEAETEKRVAMPS